MYPWAVDTVTNKDDMTREICSYMYIFRIILVHSEREEAAQTAS